MVTVTEQMKAHCQKCLSRIEQHLKDYPCGETYFGTQAGGGPYVIKNLREGVIIRPETIDSIYRYIQARECRLRRTASEAANVAS